VGLSYFARDNTERFGPAVTTRCAKARLVVVLRVALAHWCQMTVTSAARALAVTLKQDSVRRAASECSFRGQARRGSRFWGARSIGGVDKVPPVPTAHPCRTTDPAQDTSYFIQFLAVRVRLVVAPGPDSFAIEYTDWLATPLEEAMPNGGVADVRASQG